MHVSYVEAADLPVCLCVFARACARACACVFVCVCEYACKGFKGWECGCLPLMLAVLLLMKTPLDVYVCVYIDTYTHV